MAATPTDTTAIGGDVTPRRRGKSKAPNFTYDGPISVIRLELDVSDPVVRRRVERQWAAVFRLRRALQGDAAHRCRAYWAAHRERGADPKGLRDRLGLSRKGIESAAKAHIEASGWMRDHLTKAVGMHLADEVWETVDRHLFADASGHRHGPPRIGAWWDFTRIPGRARSHTKATPVSETYRLVGNLAGHLVTYRHPQLPAAVSTGRVVFRRASRAAGRRPDHLHRRATRRGGTGRQAGAGPPARLGRSRRNTKPKQYGLSPRQAARAARRAARGLKDRQITNPGGRRAARADGVPLRDRKAPGGWRYYAHLLVHQPGYQSPDTRARRAESARTGSHPVASAEQAALGPPPNRPGSGLDVAGPAENNSTTRCLALHDSLRVYS